MILFSGLKFSEMPSYGIFFWKLTNRFLGPKAQSFGGKYTKIYMYIRCICEKVLDDFHAVPIISSMVNTRSFLHIYVVAYGPKFKW